MPLRALASSRTNVAYAPQIACELTAAAAAGDGEDEDDDESRFPLTPRSGYSSTPEALTQAISRLCMESGNTGGSPHPGSLLRTEKPTWQLLNSAGRDDIESVRGNR